MSEKAISRTISSGQVQYDLTITFSNIDLEQVKNDAVSFYAWKVQRQIREASDSVKKRWKDEGITLHFSEVGKPVMDVDKAIDNMSDEQAEAAYKRLQARMKTKKAA